MCGISGIIRKDGLGVDMNLLKKMNDIIAHRGPDDDGFYFHKQIGFGHRRLSILDVSTLGHQPMIYNDRYVITYNGEVYNYLEVREELVENGYIFTSGTDTEVILAAYDLWKEKCLIKFNGMWAFAILDKIENKIFFARDRFGIKPLYYKETNDTFSFGSEIKQLLHDSENELNVDVLLESILTHIDNHTEQTYFKNILSFPASHYMYYDLTNFTKKFERYYKLEIKDELKSKSNEDLIKEFRTLFTDSVNLRLRSDVKVGTCLSGGLDSSAISIIASEAYHKSSNQKLIAINAKSMDSNNDESAYAEEVGIIANLNLNIVTPSYQNFLETIDEVVYTQEEPFGSPSMFMGWHVFQLAKKLNCSVMLNGQGGDETLLGYERYFSSTLSLFRPFQFLQQLYNQFKNSRLSLKDTILYFFYFRNKKLRIDRLKKKSLLKSEFKKDKYFQYIKKSAESFGNTEKLQLFEISVLQLPHLLRYEDRNSMRHSIETRLPFLDYRLVEMAVSLPTKIKIKNGWTKFILRKAIENKLPENIVWRKNKFGFEAPDKIWLTNYADQMLAEIKSSKILNHFCAIDDLTLGYSKLSLKDKWMYFNIARWEKIYNVILPNELNK
jgi:asparagine synthase (glutamine-hydrolysing)